MMTRLLSVVVVLVLASGVYSFVLHRRDVFQPVTDNCTSDQATGVEIKPLHQAQVSLPEAPIDLVVVGGGEILLLSPGGIVTSVDTDRVASIDVGPDTELRGIAGSVSGTVMTFSSSTVFEVPSDEEDILPILTVPSGETILDVEPVAGVVAVVVRDEAQDRYYLRVLRPGSDSTMVTSQKLPGHGRLHPIQSPSGVVYATSTAPYEVIFFSTAGSQRLLSRLRDVPLVDHSGLPASGVVALQALPLACDLLLQTFTDLRSDRRLLVLHNLSGHERSWTEIEHPFAVTHLGEDGVITGFNDAPGGREIVQFTWTRRKGD